jgi:hypothetical protein
MIVGIRATAKDAREEWRRTHPGPEPTLRERFWRSVRLWALCLLAAIILVVSLVTLGVE